MGQLTRIGKQFRFEAAHRLPDHDGKCQRPHGHSYRVEVTIVGEQHVTGPKSGMVVDFGDVSQLWKRELEPLLDHRDLNETVSIPGPTTAENLAGYIYGFFTAAIGDDYRSVERVRVWETATSWAEYPA